MAADAVGEGEGVEGRQDGGGDEEWTLERSASEAPLLACAEGADGRLPSGSEGAASGTRTDADAADVEAMEGEPRTARARFCLPFRTHPLLLRVGSLAREQWPLAGLALVLLLAWAWPNLGAAGGPLHTDVWVRWVAIPLVFLLSGLGLPARELWGAFLGRWRVHLATQTFSLVFIPLVMWAVSSAGAALFPGVARELFLGLLVLGALPTTVNSCVVFVKACEGNEAAALFNAVGGNLVGLVWTPLVVWLAIRTAVAPPLEILWQLLLGVVVPVSVGQGLRVFLARAVERLKRRVNLAYVSMLVLQLIVYSAFCNAFLRRKERRAAAGADAAGVSTAAAAYPILGALVVALHLVFLALAFALGRVPLLGFDRRDTVAVTVCGSQKTLALGIPMINILFDDPAVAALVSVPLLVYHPTQLLVAALITPRIRRWVRAGAQYEAVPLEDRGGSSSSSSDGGSGGGSSSGSGAAAATPMRSRSGGSSSSGSGSGDERNPTNRRRGRSLSRSGSGSESGSDLPRQMQAARGGTDVPV